MLGASREMTTGVFARLHLLLVALLFGGCQVADTAGSKVLDKILTEDPPKVEAVIQASPEVNPDPTGRPSPIVLLVLELKSTSVFDTADFFALWEHPDTVLAGDVQNVERLQLMPGDERELEMEFQMESQFLGVVAAYRQIEVARWRSSVETPTDRTTRVIVRIEPLEVKIEPNKR